MCASVADRDNYKACDSEKRECVNQSETAGGQVKVTVVVHAGRDAHPPPHRRSSARLASFPGSGGLAFTLPVASLCCQCLLLGVAGVGGVAGVAAGGGDFFKLAAAAVAGWRLLPVGDARVGCGPVD